MVGAQYIIAEEAGEPSEAPRVRVLFASLVFASVYGIPHNVIFK